MIEIKQIYKILDSMKKIMGLDLNIGSYSMPQVPENRKCKKLFFRKFLKVMPNALNFVAAAPKLFCSL